MSIYLSHLSLHITSSPSLAISLGILHPPLISWSMSTSGALTSLNLSDNGLVSGHYDDDSRWISDMTGIKALAAAIPECK